MYATVAYARCLSKAGRVNAKMCSIAGIGTRGAAVTGGFEEGASADADDGCCADNDVAYKEKMSVQTPPTMAVREDLAVINIQRSGACTVEAGPGTLEHGGVCACPTG